MSKSIIILKCRKCEKGSLEKEVIESNESVNIKIHKCNACKYQYGFKESLNLETIEPYKATKENILNTVSDLVSNFVYYDRKEDEDLSIEDLNNAIESGEITINEIVSKFAECLISTYPDK